MFFSLYLMDEHPARVTGRSIFTNDKNHCGYISLVVEVGCNPEGP